MSEETIEQSVLDMAGIGEPEAPTETDASTEGAEATSTDAETTEPEGEVTGEESKAEPAEPPSGSEPETPAEADESDPRFKALMAKAQDEKGKRQQRDLVIESLEKQLAAVQVPDKPPPDPVDDPEGFAAQIEARIKSVREEVGQDVSNMRYQISREVMKSMKDDYEEVESIFAAEAEQNPALQRQLGESENPSLFAYEQGKRIQALNMDPETLKAQIRAEILAELKGEAEKDDTAAKETQAEIAKAKPSLANVGNAGLETSETFDAMALVNESTGEDATRRARK